MPVPDGASADSAGSNGQRKRASASAPRAAQALALRILADRIEQQKEPTDTVTVSIEAA